MNVSLHVLGLCGDGVVVQVADAACANAIVVSYVAAREEADVMRGGRVGGRQNAEMGHNLASFIHKY